METRTFSIDPRRVRLLEVNARYMRHEVFERLVANVKRDGALTQIPFGWLVRDDETREPVLVDGEPVYEVLSGNHRVMAAVEAGLAEIEFQATDEYVTPDQRLAIQLSHNEVVGEDDPATLKLLYTAIQGVDWKLYTGFDDKKLELLEQVSPGALREADLSFRNVSLVFLPHELERLGEVWERARAEAKGAKETWLAAWGDYDAALDAIEAAGRAHGVRNTATALMVVLAVFDRHLGDLREGFLKPDGEPRAGSAKVPLAAVIEDGLIPARTAAALDRVLQGMLSRQEAGSRREAFELLVNLYKPG